MCKGNFLGATISEVPPHTCGFHLQEPSQVLIMKIWKLSPTGCGKKWKRIIFVKYPHHLLHNDGLLSRKGKPFPESYFSEGKALPTPDPFSLPASPKGKHKTLCHWTNCCKGESPVTQAPQKNEINYSFLISLPHLPSTAMWLCGNNSRWQLGELQDTDSL